MAFVKVATLDDIPPGRVKVVKVGGEEAALCNVDGEIYAVANVCTHDDGPLGEGDLHGDEIECPRHGARFCVRDGSVRVLPAIVPIPTFAVRVEGKDVLVDSVDPKSFPLDHSPAAQTRTVVRFEHEIWIYGTGPTGSDQSG